MLLLQPATAATTTTTREITKKKTEKKLQKNTERNTEKTERNFIKYANGAVWLRGRGTVTEIKHHKNNTQSVGWQGEGG